MNDRSADNAREKQWEFTEKEGRSYLARGYYCSLRNSEKL
jgi:hypothetical protein